MVAILFTVLVLYLATCYVLARSYLSPMRSIPTMPPGLQEAKVDGNPTWITPNFGAGDTLFVMAHGYGGTRGTWGDLMVRLHDQGYDCVAPAMPGQDESPDPTVGFGIKEARTIAETIRWAREKYTHKPKIVLLGLSMGGAASWLASEMEPDIDGVVTEGAYARFDETMNRFFDRRVRFGSVIFRPVVWMASAMSGLKPAEVVPLEAAERWRGKPALVIQASLDGLVESSHAERLAKAAGAELWMVPEATHAQVMSVAESEYVQRLVSFVDRLAEKEEPNGKRPVY